MAGKVTRAVRASKLKNLLACFIFAISSADVFESVVSKNCVGPLTKPRTKPFVSQGNKSDCAPLSEHDQGIEGSPVSLVRESDLRTLAERKAGPRGSFLLTRFLSDLVFLSF